MASIRCRNAWSISCSPAFSLPIRASDCVASRPKWTPCVKRTSKRPRIATAASTSSRVKPVCRVVEFATLPCGLANLLRVETDGPFTAEIVPGNPDADSIKRELIIRRMTQAQWIEWPNCCAVNRGDVQTPMESTAVVVSHIAGDKRAAVFGNHQTGTGAG